MLLSFGAITLKAILTPPNERDFSIIISIKNDTDNEIDHLTIKTNKGQVFSCSLINNLCEVGILNTGDASFTVVAKLISGGLLKANIGYAEPGTNHELLVSEFRE